MFILYQLLFLILLSTIEESKGSEMWYDSINTNATKFSGSKLIPVECEHITNKKTRFCRYRDDGLFPLENWWNWKAGHGCYWYMRPTWFKKRIDVNYYQDLEIDGYFYRIPFGKTHEGDRVGFDYKNPTYDKLIQESFATKEYYLKWKSCAETAETCCQIGMDNKNICPNEAFPCPAIWDAWSCFLPTGYDSIEEQPCPDYISSSTAPCILYSQKQCSSNGTWNQTTDYSTTCVAAPVYRRRHNFHIIVLYVSIGLSFPAVFIFLVFKKLRVLRVNLHRNLLIACIIRNILTVISKEIVILDATRTEEQTNDVMSNNGVACRILAYFTSIANNSIYACMLMDGFYLHKLIVRIFSDDPNVYIMYLIAAVLSILPTTIWAILMAIEADENCWMADGSWYQWIPDGFRIAILAINIILLLDIIRALLSKLRKNVSAQHTKSTLKAMAFLIPLFGVPFIITANRNIVNMDSCTAGDVYYYVSYSIQALQGIMVALLFCYANKEVHIQIKGSFEKLQRQYQAKFGTNNSHKAPNRRETAATYVHNNSPLSKHNDDPVQDTSEKVEDWLTGTKVIENQSSTSASASSKKDEIINNLKSDHIQEYETNGDKNVYFDRVSKFIDDSFESLNNFDNQQQFKKD